VATKEIVENPTGPPPDKALLGYADLRALGISYSREHLRRLMVAGKFPLAVALGPEKYARKMWTATSVRSWLAALPPAKFSSNDQ
jgi:hypothetical protein